MSNDRARRARLQREEYLRATLRTCEERLRKLGKPRDAWHYCEVIWDTSPRPTMLKDLGSLRDVLGQEWDVVKRPRKQPDTPAYRELHAAARRLEATGMSYAEALAVVTERRPKLYAAYERERERTLGEHRHRPAYRHAEAAALMAAALKRLDDPEAMFAAALALGEYHQFDHQEERRRKALDELTERNKAEKARVGRKGGKRKRGTVAAYTLIIRMAVSAAGARSLESVLNVLRDEWSVDDLLRSAPPFAIVAVEVDDEARLVQFKDAKDNTVHGMSFVALSKAIDRTPKIGSDK